MSVRPRPRPKPRATGSNVSATSAATSPPASTPVDESSAKPPTPKKETEDRIDDRFMKKGRFWSEIDQKEKRAKAAARESSVSESSDEDEEGERTPVKRVYTTGPFKPMPAWTKNGGKTRNKRSPSQERDTEDDDDDDDVIHLPSGSQNSTSDKERTPRKKKKRARSRSKSLTPPPPLPIHMVQQARQLLRETLGETPRAARPPSPTAMEDPVAPEDVLDPELQRLADAIKTKRHQTPDLESSTAMVNITVVWKPHPEADVDTDVPTRTYTIRRNESFHLLFQAVAESAFILTQELVVCYQNRKIFEGATPESLHIYAAGEVVACEQGTYEYLKTSRNSVTPEPEADNSRLRSPSVDATTETAAPFKLFFRAGVWKDSVAVRVTSSMTCKDAVALALKAASKANLTNTDLEGKTIHMSIDGDKVDDDEAIGNLDVEDSDLVELVGF